MAPLDIAQAVDHDLNRLSVADLAPAASPDQHAAGWQQLQRIREAQHISAETSMPYDQIKAINDACGSIVVRSDSSTSVDTFFWKHMELLLGAADHALGLHMQACAQQEVVPGALSLITTVMRLVATTFEKRFELGGALLLESVTAAADLQPMQTVMTLQPELPSPNSKKPAGRSDTLQLLQAFLSMSDSVLYKLACACQALCWPPMSACRQADMLTC
jgi:hypothetical protein